METIRILLFLVIIRTTTSQGNPPGVPGIPLEPLCELNAEIPDDVIIQCGTCASRCGTRTRPDHLNSGRRTHLCSCDRFCGFHQDCCQDFEQFCPEEHEEYVEASMLHPFVHGHEDFKCVTLPVGFLSQIHILMIHTCPIDNSECEFTAELSEDVNSFVPMYDVNRGVHYINGHCAMCNSARQVTPWGVMLNCKDLSFQEDSKNSGVVNSTDTLADITRSGGCSLEFSLTGDSRYCRPGTISSCQESCRNSRLVELCENSPQDLVLYKEGEAINTPTDGAYRNPYCALCNGQAGSTSSGISCGMYIPPESVMGIRPKDLGSFSLTLVFDFDPRKGLTVGEHPPPECSTGEVYVSDEDACRPITCPSGFVLDQSDCVPQPSNITILISGTFDPKPSVKVMRSLDQGQGNLEDSVTSHVVSVMEAYGVSYHGLRVALDTKYKNNEISIVCRITCNCGYESLFEDENKFIDAVEEFKRSLSKKIQNDVIRYLVEYGVRLKTIRAEVTSQINDVTAMDASQSDCTWLVYLKNETKFENGTKNQDKTKSDEDRTKSGETDSGTLTVLTSGKTYPSGKFEVLDETVMVCETDLREPGGVVVQGVEVVALSVVTLVCVGISVLCLVTRVLLQLFITSFRARPGRIQLQLTAALLLAFVLLIIGPFLSDIPAACTAGAVLMAYGFLAAFTWMNIIAVDTWLVFRPSSAFSRSDDESSLWVHYVLGWGIPAVLVAVSMVMNYVDVDPDYRPEFGGSRCWYTQRMAMLVYFGVPIAISIAVNIFLYIHTSINLHKAFKNARTAMKVESYHFSVYTKLFVLMGITWVFGFISALTTQLVLDFLFVILTSLQGLFLFVCFVCNKRTLAEIKKTFSSGFISAISGGTSAGRSSTSGMSVSDRRTRSTVVSSGDSQNPNSESEI